MQFCDGPYTASLAPAWELAVQWTVRYPVFWCLDGWKRMRPGRRKSSPILSPPHIIAEWSLTLRQLLQYTSTIRTLFFPPLVRCRRCSELRRRGCATDWSVRKVWLWLYLPCYYEPCVTESTYLDFSFFLITWREIAYRGIHYFKQAYTLDL